MRQTQIARKFMNTKELSTLLEIPEGTLRQWRCSGVGPKWHKMRGSVRHDESEVERFIHQSERIPSVRAITEEHLVFISTAR
jgi:predicted site-specific integrase-resolvase